MDESHLCVANTEVSGTWRGWRPVRIIPRMIYRALILIAAVLGVAASAADAHACACCDSTEKRELLGWSKDGQRILVRMHNNEACDNIHGLEVWKVGARQPLSCVDLGHDPDKSISCDQLDPVNAGKKPRRAKIERHYRGKVKELPARRIRVTRTRNGENDAHVDVVVSVKSKGRWHTVWDSKKSGAGPIFMNHGGAPDVTIVPAPRGKSALLTLAGHNRRPGTGHYPTELYWVTLP